MANMTRGGSAAKKDPAKVQRENLALKATVAATAAPTTSTDPAQQAQQAEVMGMLLEQLKRGAEEEAAQVAKDLERKKAALQAQGREAERISRELEQAQAGCSHLLRGEPRTGGQWNSDGHYNIFCLNCMKLWGSNPDLEDCPTNLWPAEGIGGAVMESVNRTGQQEQVVA